VKDGNHELAKRSFSTIERQRLLPWMNSGVKMNLWRVLQAAVCFAGVVLCVSCSSNSQSSNGNDAPISLPGTPWNTWRASTPKVPPSLLKSLDAVVAHRAENTLAVLRARGLTAHASQTCFPFEKSHAQGRAVDIAVGDWNSDGQITLLDACALASMLEMRGWKGSLAVYGHQTAQGGIFWIHADTNGAERWGGVRDAKETFAQPVIWSRREASLPALCHQKRIAAQDLRIVVQKQPSVWRFDPASNTLNLHPSVLVYAGQRLLKAYPAALGFDAIGDKQKRDDYRTPEGEFYLCEHKANSRFFRALRLSYPNAEDAARGLRQGLIDRATHNRIVRAIRRRRVPPQDTRLGSDIMIHGGGIGHNWTWGCVALDNHAIKELFDFVKPGTRVTVKAPSRDLHLP
jgi:hypothetical protein